MAFLEELGKTITGKSKEAAKKAKEIAETIQLKSQIATEKSLIQDTYAVIGKKFYSKHPTAPDEQYQEAFSKIDNALAKISLLEDEICEMEGTRVCAECGQKVERDAVFCNKCGVKMAELAESQPENTEDMEENTETVHEETPEAPEEPEEATEDDKKIDLVELVVDETEEDL